MGKTQYGMLWALLFAAAAVQAQGLKVESRGGVNFAAGGIGETEQAEFKAREQEFNLKLVFTLVEGNYVAEVNVVVKDASGKTVVEHRAEGPFFMARLPAGAYSVAVAFRDRTHTRKIKVGGRLRIEYFRWPSNPQLDFPLPRESMR